MRPDVVRYVHFALVDLESPTVHFFLNSFSVSSISEGEGRSKGLGDKGQKGWLTQVGEGRTFLISMVDGGWYGLCRSVGNVQGCGLYGAVYCLVLRSTTQ